jgi:putative Mn2+ efflux pump MntP
MINLEVTILGLALALDAGIVSFALGLLVSEESLQKKIMRFSLLSLLFGLFQGLLMWIGSRVGEYVTFSYLGPMFRYLVATIFLVIALKLFSETFKKEEDQQEGIKSLSWNIAHVLMLSFATSIDAFASGMSLATMPKAYVSSAWIGIITIGVCFFFSMGSLFLKKIPEKWLLGFGASIFFLLGLEIVIKQFVAKG